MNWREMKELGGVNADVRDCWSRNVRRRHFLLFLQNIQVGKGITGQ
jgi:hypothetical protein